MTCWKDGVGVLTRDWSKSEFAERGVVFAIDSLSLEHRELDGLLICEFVSVNIRWKKSSEPTVCHRRERSLLQCWDLEMRKGHSSAHQTFVIVRYTVVFRSYRLSPWDYWREN